MQNKASTIIKEAIIEYTKFHNENYGKIMEFSKHLEEAINDFQSLPIDIQSDLGQMVLKILAANGVLAIPIRKN